MSNIYVIGAGASGLVTSIIAARGGHKVTILEKNNKVGKKILISGNGRCNYFNDDFTINHYRSSNNKILENYINDIYKEKILSFFDSIGIIPRIKDGYYYPYANTSYAIINALLVEIRNLGINIIYNEEVINIDNNKIITKNNTYIADKIVLATGSMACPKTGSDGMGYNILTNLGHHINKLHPALVQLVSNASYLEDWAGIRCDAIVSLYIDNNYIKKEEGEVQFTNYGISGICIMNLSGLISKNIKDHKEEIRINFIPFIDNLYEYLDNRNKKLKNRTIIELLESIINYKLLYIILKESKIKDNALWSDISEDDKYRLINNLNNFNVNIIGAKDYDNAQVTTGGIPLDEVSNTFGSKYMDNLYITGELLDVDGDCGGYNLGFAWLTGIIVGENI